MATPLTVELLAEAMTGPWNSPDIAPADAKRYLEPLTQACKRFEVNDRARLSAFLAQTGHESGSFRWMREFSGDYKWYAPYYGRGPIQLTHEANYRRAGGYLGLDLVENPDLVADDPEVGFLTAGWFWRFGNGDLNPLADAATWKSFEAITRRVNGGTTGWQDRNARYEKAWDALPADLVLDDAEEPPEEEPPVSEWPTRLVKPDAQAWLRDDEGNYVRVSGGSGAADEDGWLYVARVDAPVTPAPPEPEPEPEPPRRWEWPKDLLGIGQRGTGDYVDLHPTRYDTVWRSDAEAWGRWLVDNYDVWCCTYVDHPPEEEWPGYYDDISLDVWGPAGRGDPLPTDVGAKVWAELFYYEGKPDIDWIIYRRKIWSYRGGWRSFGFNPFTWHDDHVHVSWLR